MPIARLFAGVARGGDRGELRASARQGRARCDAAVLVDDAGRDRLGAHLPRHLPPHELGPLRGRHRRACRTRSLACLQEQRRQTSAPRPRWRSSLMRERRVDGVRLADGEEIRAANGAHDLRSEADAHATAAEGRASRTARSPGGADPDLDRRSGVAEDRRRASRAGSTCPRHNRVAQGRPRSARADRAAGTRFEDHVEAWDAVVARRWPKQIPFIGIVPTAIDPTQAPDGQDTFWLWSGVVPAHPEKPWAEMRDAVGQRVLAECARYYEGLDTSRDRAQRALRSGPRGALSRD